MKTYGSCCAAIPDTRAVPIPTTPRHIPGADIISRTEAKAAWRSPVVLRDDNPTAWRNPVIQVRERHHATVDGTPIVTRYLAGMTMAEIARELHHAQGTVRRALVDHGITIRPPGGGPGRAKPANALPAAVTARILELVAAGRSYSQVAIECRVSKSTVGAIWRREGAAS